MAPIKGKTDDHRRNAKMLRYVRTHTGLTQEKLADEWGISATTISRGEKGDFRPWSPKKLRYRLNLLIDRRLLPTEKASRALSIVGYDNGLEVDTPSIFHKFHPNNMNAHFFVPLMTESAEQASQPLPYSDCAFVHKDLVEDARLAIRSGRTPLLFQAPKGSGSSIFARNLAMRLSETHEVFFTDAATIAKLSVNELTENVSRIDRGLTVLIVEEGDANPEAVTLLLNLCEESQLDIVVTCTPTLNYHLSTNLENVLEDVWIGHAGTRIVVDTSDEKYEQLLREVVRAVFYRRNMFDVHGVVDEICTISNGDMIAGVILAQACDGAEISWEPVFDIVALQLGNKNEQYEFFSVAVLEIASPSRYGATIPGWYLQKIVGIPQATLRGLRASGFVEWDTLQDEYCISPVTLAEIYINAAAKHPGLWQHRRSRNHRFESECQSFIQFVRHPSCRVFHLISQVRMHPKAIEKTLLPKEVRRRVVDFINDINIPLADVAELISDITMNATPDTRRRISESLGDVDFGQRMNQSVDFSEFAFFLQSLPWKLKTHFENGGYESAVDTIQKEKSEADLSPLCCDFGCMFAVSFRETESQPSSSSPSSWLEKHVKSEVPCDFARPISSDFQLCNKFGSAPIVCTKGIFFEPSDLSVDAADAIDPKHLLHWIEAETTSVLDAARVLSSLTWANRRKAQAVIDFGGGEPLMRKIAQSETPLEQALYMWAIERINPLTYAKKNHRKLTQHMRWR